jgi:Arc/MetJ family transcription regulator
MRTVTELDEKLLQEAMAVTGVTKRRQLLEIALQEMIRHRRIERLRQRLGKTRLTITAEDLKWMRADG